MIDTSYFWTCIGLLALGTLAIRGSLIALSSRVKVNERTREIFSYIPAAVLPAFIAPATFLHRGHVDMLNGHERMAALLVAIGVCYFTKNTLATIVSGLAVLYVISM